jgi:hypothetical protein
MPLIKNTITSFLPFVITSSSDKQNKENHFLRIRIAKEDFIKVLLLAIGAGASKCNFENERVYF